MIGSKNMTMEHLDSLDNERIMAAINDAKEELFNLRFTKATGQLETHGRFKELKRDIARLLTVLNERKLGIRTAPVSEVKKGDEKKADKKATDKTNDKTDKDVKTEVKKTDKNTEKVKSENSKKEDKKGKK